MKHLTFFISLILSAHFHALGANAEGTHVAYYQQSVGEVRSQVVVGLLELFDQGELMDNPSAADTRVIPGTEALERLQAAGYGPENDLRGDFEVISNVLSADGALAILVVDTSSKNGEDDLVYIPTPTESTLADIEDVFACSGLFLRLKPEVIANKDCTWRRCNGQRGGKKCTNCGCVYDGCLAVPCNICRDSADTPDNLYFERLLQLCEANATCRNIGPYLSPEPVLNKVSQPLFDQ